MSFSWLRGFVVDDPDFRTARRYTAGMDSVPDKEQWQAKYRAAVEALERIRARELAAMTDEEAWRRIQSLSIPGPAWRERPDWSGLVEQQALFYRRKKQ